MGEKYQQQNLSQAINIGDAKLPDDSGKVPKIEWSGLQFDSRLSNILST